MSSVPSDVRRQIIEATLHGPASIGSQCKYCGITLIKESKFCHSCGKSVEYISEIKDTREIKQTPSRASQGSGKPIKLLDPLAQVLERKEQTDHQVETISSNTRKEVQERMNKGLLFSMLGVVNRNR